MVLTRKQFNPRPTIQPRLLAEYLKFTKDYQGLCDSTLCIRKNDLNLFLAHLNKSACKMKAVSPQKIHNYIIKTGRKMTRSARKSLSSSLRSFLRFLFIKGHIKQDMVNAVPTIVTRQLEGVPRGITWQDARKLLRIPDKSTPLGRRNYAILQMIITYGVRINQATHIRLEDLDWEGGLIRFPQCKWNKALCFPLKAQVARAILAYLRRDRGMAPFPEVFLTAIGQHKPLSFKYYLGSSFKEYYQKAGIQSQTHGAHAIRHAFATQLMAKRVPIKTIADMLGHRSIRSTFIYTKVDIPHLRLLARPWPILN